VPHRSGASWFAKSKISGHAQVLAVTFHTYSRPIPSPVQNLRPARDTCEQCHWPEKFHGDKIVRSFEYARTRRTPKSVTTLQVHVGGGSERLGIAQGIHWHMNVANEVEYIATDDKRQVIPWVRVKDRFGNVREYTAEGVTPSSSPRASGAAWTAWTATTARATDGGDARARRQRANGPRRHPEDAAVRPPGSRQSAQSQLPDQEARRGGNFPQPAGFLPVAVPTTSCRGGRTSKRRSNAAIDDLSRNVFPEMNVQFGTYANNIGHMDFPGCFRCHDDNHKSKDGKSIGQDCETCHKIE
jgi:hypothetical protein